MSRRSALRGAAFVIVGMLAGCGPSGMTTKGYFFPPYRFRMTAEVETPEGIRRGSSVIEVRWSISSYEIDGEAVAVELPGSQTLFVLLRSPSAESADWASVASSWLPEEMRHDWVLPDPDHNAGDIEKGNYFWGKVAEYRGTVPIPRTSNIPWGEIDNYPYFVRFKNIEDPTSIELVDPDNLDARFGSGYRLKSLTATFTADVVVHHMQSRLPWLESVGRRRGSLIPVPRYDINNPKVVPLTPEQKIAPSDFSTELYK